jgi:L-threonylcarbamoyladenylate synthase
MNLKENEVPRNSAFRRSGVKRPPARPASPAGRTPNPAAEVLPTHTADLFRKAVCRAAELLRSGGVVALPTETVYGLAANAFDPEAVSKIYEMKDRPAHNPIIVHVASVEMARRCVAAWPATGEKLAAAFWPGPLTLVLPRSGEIPDIVTAGGATVGVRWPSHPFIQAVIRECGFPLAAPSANPSQRVSPTSAGHVRIVDGGQSQVGIESTVLDLTVSPPRVLRPGMIHEQALLSVIGEVRTAECEVRDAGSLRSPGLLRKHYAPKAKLVMLSWGGDQDLRSRLAPLTSDFSRCHIIAHTQIPSAEGLGAVSVIPHDPQAFARAIYAELHRCDQAGAEVIVVEALPATPEWSGIADRLKRAAAI